LGQKKSVSAVQVICLLSLSTLAYSAQFSEGNQALSETPGAREFTLGMHNERNKQQIKTCVYCVENMNGKVS